MDAVFVRKNEFVDLVSTTGKTEEHHPEQYMLVGTRIPYVGVPILCQRMPALGDRCHEATIHDLHTLDEPQQVALGLVHILIYKNYIKLGKSEIQVDGGRDSLGVRRRAPSSRRHGHQASLQKFCGVRQRNTSD